MNAKTRNKMQKHFGLGYTFNNKAKIPLADIVSASYVMGAQNSETFWNTIIECKKQREKQSKKARKEYRKKMYSPNDRRYK